MTQLVEAVRTSRVCQIQLGSAEYVHHQCEDHDVYIFRELWSSHG
jgi:hypothetical protein